MQLYKHKLCFFFRVSSSSKVSQFSRLIAYYKSEINVLISTNRRRRESSAPSLSHVNLLIIYHECVCVCWPKLNVDLAGSVTQLWP